MMRPTQWHGCVTEWTESQLCWTIHRQQTDCQIAVLRWFVIPLNQLNISTQEKSKILLMCPWDRRVQRQNKVANPSNWMWKNSCFSGIERICRIGRQWFALHLSNNFWAPHCISGSWTDISLLTIRSKFLIGAKGFWGSKTSGSLWNGLHCWTADWAAKSRTVESLTQFWVDVQTMEPNLWSVWAGNKSYFSFSNYIPLWSCFSNDIIIFKTKHQYQLQCKDDIGVRWRPQTLISTNLCKLRDKILNGIRECGRSTKFAKPSVYIILVVLVHLESAKIYTGPKIDRALKRLGNTGINPCSKVYFWIFLKQQAYWCMHESRFLFATLWLMH